MQTLVPIPHSSPNRWSMPPPRLGFNPPQGFQTTRPSFPAHQFQPRMPNQASAGQSVQPINELDAKRPVKKTSARKTVDYNSAILHYLEARVWQRPIRDRRAVQPDPIYYADIMPPQSMLNNPTNAVTTKFVRTSTNKMRCPIFCCVWTPEGRRLITGASSGEFTLWNGLTFNFETILQAHDCPVRSMVWSHNDLWMVTGDHAGFVKYWQSNMNNVKMFQAHKEAIRGISFCPTDTKFVTCSDDGTVRLMDFFRCYEEKIFRGHGADVKSVDWHPQKGLIVSGSKDSQQPIKLWDPRCGESLATIHVHKSTVMCTKWNQNGNWLLTGSRDHLLKIFDIRNLNQEMQTFRGHKREVCSVAWHPQHETLFASGGSDGSIMFWEVGTDKEIGSMEQAHDGIVWTLSWHPLGHILCSGSNDHTSKFWTRNRPGDKMRDKYNLNTLPKGVDETNEYDEPANSSVATPTIIPGMGLEQSLLDKLKPAIPQEPVIPGLDFDSEESQPTKKVPFAKPIPRSFQQQWMENKRPVSLLPAPENNSGIDQSSIIQEPQVPIINLTQENPSQNNFIVSQGAPPTRVNQGLMGERPGVPQSGWNQANGSELNDPNMKVAHKNQHPGMMQNSSSSSNSNKFGFRDQSSFHQSDNRNEQDTNKWTHNGDRDERSRNYQSPNDGKSDWKNKSRNSQNYNNRTWDSDFGGDQDERMFSKRMDNDFGDSDLRTPNEMNPPHENDKDDRLNFSEQSSGSRRNWNGGPTSAANAANSGNAPNATNSANSENAENFSASNPRYNNPRNRGRNWNAKPARGRMR
ncbi:pre-mRNA 3' end processing protein WDR33 [Nymphon striatum]|nr:pre-mRNA 3' end processing protein WDR33 [Nymphon striatum]